MDHVSALFELSARGLKHLIKSIVVILASFITAMSDNTPSSSQTTIDPRLLSAGTGHGQDLQELVKQAQEIRKTMSSSNHNKHGSSTIGSKQSVSPELLTKVDSILAIVQNLQTNQREIYNYVRAIAPKYSVVNTSGPTEHFETVNQTHNDTDNIYLEKLRKNMKRS